MQVLGIYCSSRNYLIFSADSPDVACLEYAFSLRLREHILRSSKKQKTLFLICGQFVYDLNLLPLGGTVPSAAFGL